MEKSITPATRVRSSCLSCRFQMMQKAADATLQMQCRLDPPKILVLTAMTPNGPQQQAIAIWPGVSNTDWCGKYESEYQ